MKRKLRAFKHLFLTIARSSAINWIIFLTMIAGVVFNLFGLTFYKFMVIFLCLEVLFVDANDKVLLLRKETDMIDLSKFTNKITYDTKIIDETYDLAKFYTTLGFELDKDHKLNVMRIAMNSADKDKLHDALMTNKIKYLKGHAKQRYRDAAAWEWLGYAPEGHPDVPSGEIWYTDDYKK